MATTGPGEVSSAAARTTLPEIRFLGHSTVLVQLDGVRILTDPVLRDRVAHLRRRERLHPEALGEPVDAVVLSHIHQDHLDFPSLATLGRGVRLIVPRGAAGLLARRGFHTVEELRAGDATEVGGVRVIATPALHDGFRPPFGPRADCLGFLLHGSARIYFAGDTDLFPGMGGLGRLDLALLPVWGWGPWIGAGHLDPARAAEAAALMRPRLAVPIHWGTLHPIGLGRWSRSFLTQPPRDFAAFARRAVPHTTVHVVPPGGALTVGA
jgi:L-ascorbate metabolism protein UlaG (beta-lactamase superfamily)